MTRLSLLLVAVLLVCPTYSVSHGVIGRLLRSTGESHQPWADTEGERFSRLEYGTTLEVITTRTRGGVSLVDDDGDDDDDDDDDSANGMPPATALVERIADVISE